MRCELCGHEDKSAADKEMGDDLLLMVEHFRLTHPEQGDFERWPDGSLVILDTTLEPKDFGS